MMYLFHHFQLEQINSPHNKYSSISFMHSSCTLFLSFIYFNLTWITCLSNLSNYLIRVGKTCFPSTNNNVLLAFSKDTSYEGIIFDKSFICHFVLHFYESHINVDISIQNFTCHDTVIQGKKSYINPIILSPQLFIPRCSVHLPIASSLMQCEFSSSCYPGSTVTYLHFC